LNSTPILRLKRSYLKDVAIEPNFPYSYEDLGLLYAQQNKTEKAEHAYRQAIERDNTLVNSYVGLGKLYRQAGRREKSSRKPSTAS
jgi:tetratricopeptide (TPR) repeat protein